MISRFFKKSSKKAAPSKKTPSAASKTSESKKKTEFQKILTAEGWKRLMMKKYGSSSKK